MSTKIKYELVTAALNQRDTIEKLSETLNQALSIADQTEIVLTDEYAMLVGTQDAKKTYNIMTKRKKG